MDLEALINHRFPAVHTSYSATDTILYALGVGAGADPLNSKKLTYVYEKGLQSLFSQACVIAYPGAWLTEPKLGINYRQVVHGEQRIEFDRALSSSAEVTGEYEVLGVDDKGPGKGALVFFEKRLRDPSDNALICRVRSTYFLRGDGGCGSWGEPISPETTVPYRPADFVVDVPTIPQLALIYRLSGDLNPIHADPESAHEAGFKGPILHGLASFGLVCMALLEKLSEGAPQRLKAMFARFSRPVFPGDTVRVEFFQDQQCWRFRAKIAERGETVLDRGFLRLS